jgi:23S rRNA 5-hydroxycytidine C2501 synthase
MDLPPIPLIASTQMHNDTPEKIRFLEDVGFKRVILARELSLEEIAAIRKGTHIELECFVHGALCVSYSGQCYMSQAITGRSGNRGVCAQLCRMQYTLIDGEDNSILSDKYLLSLKDLNLLQSIPDLIGAGITSFKIEGRYKEIDYVTNVTAAYSRSLDAFILRNPKYRRRSSGSSKVTFLPDPAKTFNRGFTRYFISGRQGTISSMDTPKSIGQPLATVTALGKGFFRTDCADLKNGDGLCFFTKRKTLSGFRVERVEDSKIFPNTMKDLAKGVLLYRNLDIAFERTLRKRSGRRWIGVAMEFNHDGDTVHIAARDDDGNKADLNFPMPYEEPRDPSMAQEQLEKQLSSTGNTSFKVTGINISRPIGFYSIGFLNNARRNVLEELERIRRERFPRETSVHAPSSIPYPEKKLDYHANVFNKYARHFYERHGAEVTEPAFETLSEHAGREVMRTRYCLRHELNACLKPGQARRQLKEPLRIRDAKHEYLLKFDCDACRMSLIILENPGRRKN